MYVGPVLDIVQAIMNEPHAAAYEATVMLQPELQQYLLRHTLGREHVRAQQSVVRAHQTEQDKITPDGKRRAPTRRMMLRKWAARVAPEPAGVVTRSKVDTFA